jgi:hypothetical protein
VVASSAVVFLLLLLPVVVATIQQMTTTTVPPTVLLQLLLLLVVNGVLGVSKKKEGSGALCSPWTLHQLLQNQRGRFRIHSSCSSRIHLLVGLLSASEVHGGGRGEGRPFATTDPTVCLLLLLYQDSSTALLERGGCLGGSCLGGLSPKNGSPFSISTEAFCCC